MRSIEGRLRSFSHQLKNSSKLLIALLVILQFACAISAQGTQFDWKPVEQAIGKGGSLQPGDVFKIGLPRKDLVVTIRGVPINPVLALGSWVAFKKIGNEAVVMGDLVLTESEVGPVMWSLQESGIEQTALHNHLLDESPRIVYMHISGHGDPVTLAASIRRALSYTKTPFDEAGSGTATLKRSLSPEIDFHKVEQILGKTGKDNNGVYQFAIARVEKIVEHDLEIPPAMGVATAINFQSTGQGRTAITGDFVLTAAEVNPIIHALRENNIAVTAIHSHMLEESRGYSSCTSGRMTTR